MSSTLHHAKKQLSFTALRQAMSDIFLQITDHRDNRKITYRLHDILMSGFACMYFQDPSLLAFQERMQEDEHRNNLQTLFDVTAIPKDTQMRELLDTVDSHRFAPVFKMLYQRLQRGKHLEGYQSIEGSYYFPIDASEFFSSKDVHCKHCLVKNHRTGGTTYSHQVLQGGIMHPDQSVILPFMPEQIRNEDGSAKQDCEINAAKRLLIRLRREFPKLKLTIGGDGLYSKQPMIEAVQAKKMHYIFGAKPKDHTYLMEWLAAYDRFVRSK